MAESKEWYSRGYLPHFDHPGLVQMITFRLADALPEHVLENWRLLATLGEAAERERIEAYLDAGHGSCCLQDPRIARVVEDTLLYFDGLRYHLLAWVVMPNHVHVLAEIVPGHGLPGVLHSWKSFTAKTVNRLLGRSGSLWQREYFDRYIRDENHFVAARHYIHENPVKAGLALTAATWPYSSASR